MSSPVRVVASAAGRFAEAALRDGDGKVVAAFARSAYLESGGRMACVGIGIGEGPLNAECDEWPAQVAVGERLFVDLSRARLRASPRHLDLGPQALARLREAAQGATVGLAPLIQADPAIDVSLLARAHPGLSALRDWIARPAASPPHSVLDLVGLGPGLTPSGDDALGGAMIALRACRRADLADGLAALVLPHARRETGAISLAHLECAAAGEGAAALHDALAALASGVGVGMRIAALGAIGHSSGWDALAGVATALAGLSKSTREV